MNRKILSAWMAIVISLLCTSCEKKVALTAKDATQKFEAMGFTVADNTSGYTSSSTDLQAFLSARNNIFNIDFYEFQTKGTAVEVFTDGESNIEKIEKKSSGTRSTSVNLPNSGLKALTANGKYYYISRIDNTVVYCETNDENKDSVKIVMKKIGY